MTFTSTEARIEKVADISVDLTPRTVEAIWYICVDPRFIQETSRFLDTHGLSAANEGIVWYKHQAAGGAFGFAAPDNSAEYKQATGELAVLLHKHAPKKLVLTMHRACAACAGACQASGLSEDEFLVRSLLAAEDVAKRLIEAEGLSTDVELLVIDADGVYRVGKA
jgi:hypothetical protein